ncbi:MAG TPA: hypothetical protein VIF83_12870 [Gemmatimonadaceae bacterium]
MRRGWWIVAALLFPLESRADHRLVFEPSLQVSEVDDNNLNLSIVEPMRDRVHRITPAVALRFDSPRWRVTGGYSLDSERYAKNSSLDNDRARERASVGIQYEVGPRLRLSMDGTYIGTSTAADLNIDTGLAAARARGRSLSVGSTATFRISPQMKATVGTSGFETSVANGVGLRSQVQAFILERRVTPRDLFNIHYENIHLQFGEGTSQRSNTQFLVGRWIHEFRAHNRVTIQVGPRLSDGALAADVAAIVSHTWKSSSIALSFTRNQTTVIGYAGPVDTKVLQTKFAFTPNRRLTAYATPAIFRSTHRQLEGTVLRFSLGARYALNSLIDADVAYNRDMQNGGIDPLFTNAKISHATLSLGFVTRWNNPDRRR